MGAFGVCHQTWCDEKELEEAIHGALRLWGAEVRRLVPLGGEHKLLIQLSSPSTVAVRAACSACWPGLLYLVIAYCSLPLSNIMASLCYLLTDINIARVGLLSCFCVSVDGCEPAMHNCNSSTPIVS